MLRPSKLAVEPPLYVFALVAQITCPGAWLEHIMLVWVSPCNNHASSSNYDFLVVLVFLAVALVGFA